MKDLLGAGRPKNFDYGFLGRAQSEMQTLIVSAKVASGRGCETCLPIYRHPCPVAVAIASLSLQRNRKPVIISAATVEKKNRRSAEARDHGVHAPVIINISKGHAACCERLGNAGIGAFEMSLMIQREERQFPVAQGSVNVLHIIEHVTLRDEQILPAVIVEIFHANAPAGTHRRQGAKSGLQTGVIEIAATLVVVEGVNFARQHRDENVRASIIIVVLKYSAHPRHPFAVRSEGHP